MNLNLEYCKKIIKKWNYLLILISSFIISILIIVFFYLLAPTTKILFSTDFAATTFQIDSHVGDQYLKAGISTKQNFSIERWKKYNKIYITKLKAKFLLNTKDVNFPLIKM